LEGGALFAVGTDVGGRERVIAATFTLPFTRWFSFVWIRFGWLVVVGCWLVAVVVYFTLPGWVTLYDGG
jgi:hypothetical protein